MNITYVQEWTGGTVTQEATTEERPEQADRQTVWRSGNFLLLWGGQTVAELGSRISSVAVPLLAAETLDASLFQISLLTTLAGCRTCSSRCRPD
ncbi:hypothetical protein [Streptomyces sp. NPDC021356]|uniref:hypothetical protein n=1 Tax=Streptomyces sp. NPDC021356 TaxID=3154900 RepID=UPI0033DDF5A4